MRISEEDVRHVAKLAKLTFADNEITHFTEQMDDIMAMFEQLNQVDTTDVPMTTHGYDTLNVMREDQAVAGMDRDVLFKNVKTSERGMIKVPAIIDNGEAGA